MEFRERLWIWIPVYEHNFDNWRMVSVTVLRIFCHIFLAAICPVPCFCGYRCIRDLLLIQVCLPPLFSLNTISLSSFAGGFLGVCAAWMIKAHWGKGRLVFSLTNKIFIVYKECIRGKSMRRFAKVLLWGILFIGVIAFTVHYISQNNIAVLSPKGWIGMQQKELIIVCSLLMSIVVIPVFFMVVFFTWRYRKDNEKARHDPEWGHSYLAETLWWGAPIIIITFFNPIIVFNILHWIQIMI